MIKFRQKDFSKLKLSKVIYRTKKITRDVFGNVGKSTKSNISTPKAGRKSNYQLAKESVKASNNISKKIAQTKASAYNIASNPGKATADAIGFAAENPVAGTVIATGYTVAPGLPGTSAAGIGLEGAAKKIPIYRKTTEALGNSYKKSKLKEVIEPVTNAVVNTAKSLSGVPIN
jgi:hypothetical protein